MESAYELVASDPILVSSPKGSDRGEFFEDNFVDGQPEHPRLAAAAGAD